MGLAYPCRARRSEVPGLTRDGVTGNGLRIKATGSNGETTQWSTQLRVAVATQRPDVPATR